MVRPSDTDQNKYRQGLRAAREVNAGRLRAPQTQDRRITRQVQHRLTDAEIQLIADQYRSGASTYALAAQWKINRETVTLALRRAGVQIRARGELTPQQLQEARALQAQGWSLIRLGQKFGIDPKTMKKRLACAPLPSAPGPDGEPGR